MDNPLLELMTLLYLHIFAWYFAFDDRMTSWSIGCSVDLVLSAKKSTLQSPTDKFWLYWSVVNNQSIFVVLFMEILIQHFETIC